MRVRNGVDIVAVERIEKSMKRPGFMARCFSPEEQEYICRKACPAETAAALWAAKEAFGKAMGVGLSGWAMPEAAVAYGETGAPYFTLERRGGKAGRGLAAGAFPEPRWRVCHSDGDSLPRGLTVTPPIHHPRSNFRGLFL